MKATAPKDRKDVSSPEQLAVELKALRATLALPETEHTWENIAKGLVRFTAAVRGGACRFEEDFVRALREQELAKKLISCITTERTRLSSAALDLLAATTRLGKAFAPLLAIYGPHIIRLCSKTNKLYIARAQACLNSIVVNTRLASIFPYLRDAMDDKSGTMRKAAVETALAALQGEHLTIDRVELEKRYLDDVECIIRKGAADREPKTREAARAIWAIFQAQWPERVEAFAAPLSPTLRKYLSLPVQGGADGSPPTKRMSPIKFMRSLKANPGLGLAQSAGAPATSATAAQLPALSQSVASSRPTQAGHARSASAKAAPMLTNDLFAPVAGPSSAKLDETQAPSPPASKIESEQAEAPMEPVIPAVSVKPALAQSQGPSLPSALLAAGARAPSRNFKPSISVAKDKPVPTVKPGRAVTAPVMSSAALAAMMPPPARPALPATQSSLTLGVIEAQSPSASSAAAVGEQLVPNKSAERTAPKPAATSRPTSRQETSRPEPAKRAPAAGLSASQSRSFKPVRPAGEPPARPASALASTRPPAVKPPQPALSKSTSTSTLKTSTSGMTRSSSFTKQTAASIAKQADALRIRKEREAAREAAPGKGRKVLPPHLAGALLLRKPVAAKALVSPPKQEEEETLQEAGVAVEESVTASPPAASLPSQSPAAAVDVEPADSAPLPTPSAPEISSTIAKEGSSMSLVELASQPQSPSPALPDSSPNIALVEAVSPDVPPEEPLVAQAVPYVDDAVELAEQPVELAEPAPVHEIESEEQPAVIEDEAEPELDIAVAPAELERIEAAPDEESTQPAFPAEAPSSVAPVVEVVAPALPAHLAEQSLPSPFLKPQLETIVAESAAAPAFIAQDEAKEEGALKEDAAPETETVVEVAESAEETADQTAEEMSMADDLSMRTASPTVSHVQAAETAPSAWPPMGRTIIRSPPFASLPTPQPTAPAAFAPFRFDVPRPSLSDSDLGTPDFSLIASAEMPVSGVLSPSPERMYTKDRYGAGGKPREPLSPLVNKMPETL